MRPGHRGQHAQSDIVAGKPALAEEQQQAAEWVLADKAQSYGGKFYSGDEAKGVIAARRDGMRKK